MTGAEADLLAAVGSSLDTGDVDGASSLLRRNALRLLGRGELIALRAAVARVPVERRDLVLRIADVDAAARLHAADLADIEALAAEAEAVHAAGGEDYRWWVAAVRAEHFMWRSDTIAFVLAAEALEAMPSDPLLPAATLAARGRLRRISAVAELFAQGASGPDRAFATLDAALDDLWRAGWEEERNMSALLVHLLWTAVSHDDMDRTRHVVEEAALRLDASVSPYAASAYVALAFVHFVNGDMPGMHAALTRTEHIPDPPAARLASYMRALADFIGRGADEESLERMDVAIDGFRADYPEAAGAGCTMVASILLDFGDVDDAEVWYGRSITTRQLTPLTALDNAVTRARIEVLRSAQRDALEQGEATLATMSALGLGRDAAKKALRMAHDCARVGLVEDALRLHALGTERLRGVRRTVWEELYARPLDLPPADAAPVDPAAPPTVRVLGAGMTLAFGGTVAAVPAGLARLVAVLVDERRPLSADFLVDRLWGDLDLATGRNRLRVTLHRLRRLVPSAIGPVERRGDDLVIASGWRVDAWDFADLAAGASEAQRHAFDLYESDVCATQLAYDDVVSDLRHRLRAVWLDTAESVVRSRAVDVSEVAAKAEALEVDDPRFAGVLANALAESGRSAQAEVWRSRSVG